MLPGNELDQRVNTLLPELVALRRDLHQHPELGYHEDRTAGTVLSMLAGLDLEMRSGVVDTGIVGTIPGARPGPTLLLRADMDALPILEANTHLAYASQTPGVMHACGHDAHTAILVGAVKVLAGLREQLPGQVRFLFQPAEEEARQRPGDAQPVSAATQVIEAGILDGVSAVLGLHVWPDLTVGKVGFRHGAAMAGSCWFRIRLHGRSVHAAQPHKGVDSITAVANLINLLQLVVTRNVDPGLPVLLNVGTIQGGYRRNVVADMVEITGTVRALDQELLDRLLPTRIERALQGLCLAVDATYTFDYYPEVPVLLNSTALAEVVRTRLIEASGPTDPVVLNDVALTGEDFAFYTQRVPGLFLFLGCSDPDVGERVPLHSPRFDLDERAIGIGVRAVVRAALALLNSAGSDYRPGTGAHASTGQEQPSAL